jgi:uncharacterized protein GlcG (DUF336 family)
MSFAPTAVALVAAALTAAAPAETPAASPAPSMAEAQHAASAAFAACKGVTVAFALIDANGPRYVAVSDGGNALFGQFAIRKATTALRYAMPSAALRDAAKSDPKLAEALKSDPTLIGFGGGVPFDGGAVAIAGAPSQDLDEACARAGLAAIARTPLQPR